jgi:hypothetical protein
MTASIAWHEVIATMPPYLAKWHGAAVNIGSVSVNEYECGVVLCTVLSSIEMVLMWYGMVCGML